MVIISLSSGQYFIIYSILCYHASCKQILYQPPTDSFVKFSPGIKLVYKVRQEP